MKRVRISAPCKRLTVWALAIALVACQTPSERLRTGDLLFVGSSEGAGSMDEAIVAATGNLTHVAIIQVDQAGMPWVIENALRFVGNPQDMSLSPLLMDVPFPIPET